MCVYDSFFLFIQKGKKGGGGGGELLIQLSVRRMIELPTRSDVEEGSLIITFCYVDTTQIELAGVFKRQQ